jgi:putative transposase
MRLGAKWLMGGWRRPVSCQVLLSVPQLKQLSRHLPRWRGLARVGDHLIVSEIVYAIRNGFRSKDAPPGYGPHKTLDRRFVRQSHLGVFARIFAALVEEAGMPKRLMINRTHLKAHLTAATLLKKGC